jgi:hypothetical protein
LLFVVAFASVFRVLAKMMLALVEHHRLVTFLTVEAKHECFVMVEPQYRVVQAHWGVLIARHSRSAVRKIQSAQAAHARAIKRRPAASETT